MDTDQEKQAQIRITSGINGVQTVTGKKNRGKKSTCINLKSKISVRDAR